MHDMAKSVTDRTHLAMRAACLALCLTLCACIDIPEVDGTVLPELEDAAYPDLVPLDPLLARSIPSGVDTEETTKTLQARIVALRARALALQGR